MHALHPALNLAIESHHALKRFTRAIVKQRGQTPVSELFDSVHRILADRQWMGIVLPDEEYGAYTRLDHAVKGVLARNLAASSGLASVPVIVRVGNLGYEHSRRSATRYLQSAFYKFAGELREHHAKLFDAYRDLRSSLQEQHRQRMQAASGDTKRLNEEIHVYRKILSGLTELDTLLDHFAFHLNEPKLMQGWEDARQRF